MKTHTYFLCAVLMLFLSIFSANAQYTFVLDALHSDSVALYPYDIKTDDKNVLKFDKAEDFLPNGTLVTINGGEDSITKTVLNGTGLIQLKDHSEDYVAVTYEGKKYYVSTEDLVISETDTTGVKDFINTGKNLHTTLGHWYNSSTPYIIIIVLLAVATLFAFLMNSGEGLRKISVLAVPILLLLVVIIEILGIYSVGTSMLWWLDTDRYGWGTSIFRFIFFALAIAMQVFSMNIYMRGLLDINSDDEDVDTPKLDYKRPIYFAIGGALTAIIIVLIFAFTNWNSNLGVWLALILFIVFTGIGIYSSAKNNIGLLGTKAGIAFSIFALIYAVGLVVAFALLIIGFISAFLEMILTIIVGFIGFVFMSKVIPKRTYYEGSTKYEVYED